MLCAAVLVLAGAAKLRRPEPTVSAAIVLGLPRARRAALALLVRAFATGEVILGLVCLIAPFTVAAALLAALIFREAISWQTGLGGFAVLAAIALTLRADARERSHFGTQPQDGS